MPWIGRAGIYLGRGGFEFIIEFIHHRGRVKTRPRQMMFPPIAIA